MRNAVVDFQQKHTLIDQADIKRSTLEALARPLLENDFAALQRVLAERAAHAGGILEDGSAIPPTTTDLSRQRRLRHPIPDLVGAATTALLARLDIATPEDAVAFFRRRTPADMRWLRVAVRFPPLPEYYGSPGSTMDLSAEIDRGDVWYDFPFDAAGTRLPQPRERFPSFTLYVKWRGERVPLVSWRTTVGGWRVGAGVGRPGVFPLQGLGRRPARLAAHRRGAGLDPAAVVSARLDGEGEEGQRHVREGHQL